MKFVCRIILFSLLILGTSTTVVTESSQNLIRTSSLSVQDEFETLMEKIREDFAQNPLIDEALNKYDTTKGCFTDIDYSRRDRTNWEPLIHINRLYDFAFAYTNPQNIYYQSEDIYNKNWNIGISVIHTATTGGTTRLPSHRKSAYCLYRCASAKKRFHPHWKLKPCNAYVKTAEILPNGRVPTGQTSHSTGFTAHAWKRTKPT